jgi:spore maturation protein CgeB
MAPTIELFSAQSGALSARARFDDQSVRHIHSTVAPEQEHTFFQSLQFFGDIIVLAGTGLGYHLYTHLTKISPTSTIVALEFYPQLLDHALQKLAPQCPLPLRSMSSQSDVTQRSNALHFEQYPAVPKIQVIRHPVSYSLQPAFYDALIDELHRRYCPPPHPSEHNTRQRRVMLLTGSFFLQTELHRALQNHPSIQVDTFDYKRCTNGLHYEHALQQALQTQRPDAVVSVNMKGFDGEGILPQLTQRAGCALAVWFVDDPHPILLNQRGHIGPHCHAFCWERTYLPYLRASGFASAHWLPLATDPMLWKDNATMPGGIQRPLSFVGSSMGESFLAPLRQKFLWSDRLQPLVEKTAALLLTNPQTPLPKLLAQACASLGIAHPFSDERNRTWLSAYCIHFASMLRRRELIASLIPQGIELFGDPQGWQQSLGQLPLLPRLHGDIDYHQLGPLYRSSAVNINTTSCQMATAVNQRIFDIPAAGGFVLTDRQTDALELFEPSQLALYHDRDDAHQQVRYYVNNPREAQAIARAAAQAIQARHTYTHRLCTLLNTLFTS